MIRKPALNTRERSRKSLPEKSRNYRAESNVSHKLLLSFPKRKKYIKRTLLL